jgi:16S rRNA (adenine1518-N6/adenine1519-N6)-dimethyltransferase
LRRRRLGQHYLVDREVIHTIVGLARIKPSDRVLEIGTGRGVLTKELSRLGASLVGYEVDEENFEETLEAVRGSGTQIRLADAFDQSPEFDVLVASLPYSQSATFVEWLSASDFDRAVVVLQDDFVKKIVAPPGDRNYRGVSAIAQIAFEISILGRIERSSFAPQPRVNSAIVAFLPRRRLAKKEIANIMRLFSLRRRQVDSALRELEMQGSGKHGTRRVYWLMPEEVHELCRPRRQE